jgi:hypothetical protein
MHRHNLVLAAAVLALAALASPGTAAVGEKDHPDWPCVQRKVQTLTSTQIWDGPAVDDIKDWSTDNELVKLVPGLSSRRVPLEDASASIKAYAAALADGARDDKLKRLFAGVLSRINEERASVIGGIERYQRRQRSRAEEIERQSSDIIKLKEQAKDEAAQKALATAEEKHAWDVRVFQERQQNIPLACEIPVAIEARAFEIGREIRTHMSK